MRIIVLLSFLLLLSVSAFAQTKYSEWSDPDGKNDGKLIERLNELIDQAEKARAADPAFLRDLRDLARGYSAQPQATTQPVSRTVLSDDFGDGDFTVRWAGVRDDGQVIGFGVLVVGELQEILLPFL